MARDTKDINHAQFPHDTILLRGSSLHTVVHFKLELDSYCTTSGSKINLRKSQIYSWNINPRELSGITQIIGIEGVTIWDSFKYLGVPIFRTSPKATDWAPLVDKFKKKILSWGAIWLNLAGKVVLIKYVLSSLPIYHCSILLAPAKILSSFDALLRKFLWQGGKNNGGKKFAIVS